METCDRNVAIQSQIESISSSGEGQSGMVPGSFDAGNQSNSNSLGNQPKSPPRKQTDSSQSVEMDSPTKRFDEFSALIGETEASMRDKLSSLTLPDPNGHGQEENIDISVAEDEKTANTDKNKERKDDKIVVKETETGNPEDTSIDKCASTTDSPDNDSIATGMPSVQAESSDVIFQPAILNVVSNAPEEDDTVDHLGTVDMTDNKDVSNNATGGLCRNKNNENDDVTMELKDTKTDEVSEMLKPQNVNERLFEKTNVNVSLLDSKTGFVEPIVISDVEADSNPKELKSEAVKGDDKVVKEKKFKEDEMNKQGSVNSENQMDITQVVETTTDDPMTKSNSNDEEFMEISEDDQISVSEAKDGNNLLRQESENIVMVDVSDDTSVRTVEDSENKDVNEVPEPSVNNKSVVEKKVVEIKPISEKERNDDDMETECELIIDETESTTLESNNDKTEGDDNNLAKVDDKGGVGDDNKSCDTEHDTEDNLMIIDVRSLSGNNEIIDFNKSDNVAIKKTGLEYSDNSSSVESHEDENTGQVIESSVEHNDNTIVEKPQTSSSSKSKRKSPNSVRRITEIVDSSQNFLPQVPESGLPLTESTIACSSADMNRSVIEESDGSVMSRSTSIATTLVSESLPVISNTFSMKDIPKSNLTIKDEPPDDGMYGVMQSYGNIPQMHNTTVASFRSTSMTLVPGKAIIHKGQILSQGISNPQKTGRPPNAQKLVISKVPPIVCPTIAAVPFVNSTSGSYIQIPMSTVVAKTGVKVLSGPHGKGSGVKPSAIVTLRNLAPRSAAPVIAQNGNVFTLTTTTAPSKDKTKESTQKNLSTINIHSVGVARITDLIARKNPIPTFKPDPVPDYLMSVQSSKVFPCYECGDSFHFEKSLRQHIGRCSMNIFYKCEKCVRKLKFTNKCQLLNHLRSHLNIEKTQAVPIHIKSDSIEIVTNFDAISADKPFEWYKEGSVSLSSKATNDHTLSSSFQCVECQEIFHTLKLLQDHVHGNNSDLHFCEECPIYVNSNCALEAHKKLHRLNELKQSKSPTVNQLKILKSLSCPECGKHFNNNNVTSLLTEMALHLKNACFHLSRLPAYKCTKCMKVFQNFEGLRNHLNTCLEHYYKCGLCPMALKSLKSLEAHYDVKHKQSDNTEVKPGMADKIIYRCHICDTLIDDKSFLVQHIDKHLEECKKHPETHFHCLQCGQMFMQKKDLLEHKSKHPLVRRQFWCTFCSKDKVKPVPYIHHMLSFHTATRSHLASKSIVKFCNSCGLVCIGEHMFRNHACLAARNTTVIVGDRSKQKGDSTKTKPYGKETSIVSEVHVKDLPANVSKTCPACSAVFYSSAQREGHLKDHRDFDLIFICKYCDKKNVKSYHELRSHEIACKAMIDMPKDLLKEKLGGGQKKEGSTQCRKIRSKAELNQQRKTNPNNAMEMESYLDGVELTPKENKKSARKKETVEYFMCDKCDAVFTRKSKQEEHIKFEHGIHPCHLCGLMHESQSSLRKHLMVDHEGKRMLLYCGVCKNRKIEKAFNVRGKLIKHLKVKHRMKTIDESKIITQLPGFPETVKDTIPEAQKRKMSMSPETSVKKLRIEGESDFKCAKCLFTSSVKSEFRLHILDHKASESYQCFECGLCFAVLPSLRKHVFMVHKVKDFKSYMAENKIEEPTALEDNDVDIIREPDNNNREVMEESSEEDPSSDPLECKVCYRAFDNEKVLKSHMRTHGMAFIKKSRRRAQIASPVKKAENEVAYSSSQDEGKQDGIVIKLKRLKPQNDDEKD